MNRALEPNLSPGGDGRIPSLDGWRALAIVLVLGSHFAFTTGLPPGAAHWFAMSFDGELGVRIFFVLSGFLISLLLFREAERTGAVSLRHFYLRRTFRILPVYFAYLAVLAALALLDGYTDSASSWLGCLTFTRNVVGRGRSGSVHFWSLAVEEQFYLVWPLLLSGLHLWRRRPLCLALLALPVLVCPFLRLAAGGMAPGGSLGDRLLGERSILLYADSLAVGCLGAWWAGGRTSGAWSFRRTLGLIAGIAVIIAGHAGTAAGFGRVAGALIPSVQAWAILGCLLLCRQPSSPGFRLLNSRPVMAIGLLSYSLYVWHFLFLHDFMGRSRPWLTDDWRLWLLPAVAVSALSYRYLEAPLVALRRRLQD